MDLDTVLLLSRHGIDHVMKVIGRNFHHKIMGSTLFSFQIKMRNANVLPCVKCGFLCMINYININLMFLVTQIFIELLSKPTV